MSSGSLSLFVNHVYDLAGSPAMYFFNLIFILTFDIKKLKIDTIITTKEKDGLISILYKYMDVFAWFRY